MISASNTASSAIQASPLSSDIQCKHSEISENYYDAAFESSVHALPDVCALSLRLLDDLLPLSDKTTPLMVQRIFVMQSVKIFNEFLIFRIHSLINIERYLDMFLMRIYSSVNDRTIFEEQQNTIIHSLSLEIDDYCPDARSVKRMAAHKMIFDEIFASNKITTTLLNFLVHKSDELPTTSIEKLLNLRKEAEQVLVEHSQKNRLIHPGCLRSTITEIKETVIKINEVILSDVHLSS
ncbi:hypothetical protein F3J37_11730 [Pantoea sp. Al-1710]|uniref:Uncharacterized protein n=1 Tax=Candidatus Pantoea communis TaxID=2608354 RepID=A0ABX0RNY9_9GAMM|nr:hypothetical protein [Pantoea communis]NIG19341.1 hypothetical protein [Pantoea communis]